MADHKALCGKILSNKNYLRPSELKLVEELQKKDKVSDIVINELSDLNRRVSEHIFSPDALVGEVEAAQKRIAAEAAAKQAPKPAPAKTAPKAEPRTTKPEQPAQGGKDAARA